MSIPNRQIGWSTESNLLWQVAKQIQRLSGIIANSGVPGSQDLESVTSLGYVTSSPIESAVGIYALDQSTGFGAAIEVNGTLILNTNGSTATLGATNVSTGNCNLEFPDATTETLAIAVTTGSAKYADIAGQIQILDLAWNYINDAAAQAGGIPVGGLYHTAGVVKLRLV